MTSKQTGDRGEDQAADYLVRAGYHIVKRNLRYPPGEVDIVVYRDDTLAFVEVKHWTTIGVEDLERSIGAAKRRRIIACARRFLADHAEWRGRGVRFDIVHVASPTITHYADAFTESGFR